jgi:hypothetical protein
LAIFFQNIWPFFQSSGHADVVFLLTIRITFQLVSHKRHSDDSHGAI